MAEEKKSLIKILKDENFRAETKKYTTDSMNRTSTSVSNTSTSFISANNHMIKNTYDNNTQIISVSSGKKTEKKIVKKKKKIKKKKDGKNSEKIVKSGEIIQKDPGKKIKLLTYKKLDDNPVEENKEEEKKEKNDVKNEKKDNEDKKIIQDEVKPIIKDKEKEKENKMNRSRKDLLNSLRNLQYNYDNLMSIGIHGNKILNKDKK